MALDKTVDDRRAAPVEYDVFGPLAPIVAGMSEAQIDALCDRIPHLAGDRSP